PDALSASAAGEAAPVVPAGALTMWHAVTMPPDAHLTGGGESTGGTGSAAPPGPGSPGSGPAKVSEVPRTPDGKYAPRNGQPGRDGAIDELTAWEHLEVDGAKVMRESTPVSAPGQGTRIYDGTVQIDGKWYGIETKGGTGSKKGGQAAFDNWLNAPGNTVKTKDGRTLVGVVDVWVPR
ncbi:hypothetical protein K1W54_16765, partial [Micromonospora sp. CPCC 205371]|nr:hypothetical protein [Micromonospora sp. CPCC 205371]